MPPGAKLEISSASSRRWLDKKLQNDGDRIQNYIEEYAGLNQQIMQLTAIISDSVKKIPESHGVH